MLSLSQWFYVTLKDEVDDLIVCNPVYLAKKLEAKTDFRDALYLAQELRAGHLKSVYHDESRWIELRALTINYLSLVGEIIRTKKRLKAVVRSQAINTNVKTGAPLLYIHNCHGPDAINKRNEAQTGE